MKRISNGSGGFTLIELMVVLVIIGVLAALIVPNMLDRADDARVTAARTDVNNLMQALKLYKLDNLRYPSQEQGLQALVAKPTTGTIPPNWRPYLDKLPSDPWKHPVSVREPGPEGRGRRVQFQRGRGRRRRRHKSDIGSWEKGASDADCGPLIRRPSLMLEPDGEPRRAKFRRLLPDTRRVSAVGFRGRYGDR